MPTASGLLLLSCLWGAQHWPAAHIVQLLASQGSTTFHPATFVRLFHPHTPHPQCPRRATVPLKPAAFHKLFQHAALAQCIYEGDLVKIWALVSSHRQPGPGRTRY